MEHRSSQYAFDAVAGRPRERSFSLRAALSLLVLIAVAPVFAVVIQSSLSEQRARVERAEATTKALADLAAANQEQLIEGARQMLSAMSLVMPSQAGVNRDACTKFVRDLQAHYPSYSNLGYLDAGGAIVCAAAPGSDGLSARDRLFFRRAADSGGFSVGEYMIGRASGKPALAFGMPVHRDDALVGVIFAALDLRLADRVLGRISIPKDAGILVTDGAGVVLASGGSSQAPVGTRLTEPFLMSALRSRQASIGRASDSAGGNWIVAAQPVTRGLPGRDGVFVLATTSLDGTVASARRRLYWQLGALVVITAAGALCAWVFGERVLARPIRRLLDRQQALERGEPQPAARGPSRLRELRRLEEGFADMALALDNRSRQRDEAQMEVAGQNKMLESIFDSLAEGVLVADPRGRYIHVNAAALRILPGLRQLQEEAEPLRASTRDFGIFQLDGITPLTPEQRPTARALRGETVDRLRCVLHGRLTGGLRIVAEVSARPLNDPHGNTLGAVLVVADATAAWRAESALREAGEFSRQVIDGAREGIAVFDRSLHYRVYNAFMQELTGHSAADAIGRHLSQVVDAQRLAVVLPRLMRALAGEVVQSEDEPRPGGAAPGEAPRRWLSVKYSPLRDAQGDVVGAIVLASDVTGRVLAQRSLRQLNETLEQRVTDRTRELALANKELESFSYSVSHDLRAPLHVIDGFGRALLTAHADRLDAKGLHYLQRIQAATRQMGHLIDDLLSLAKVTRAELRREPVDLGGKTWLLIEQLRSRFPHRQVTVAVDDGLTAVGDPRLLMVVLHNLVENAWKFTARTPDARIHVGRLAKRQGEGSAPEAADTASGVGVTDEPVYFVADNGAGFEMAYVDKLFQAFQRLHRAEEFEGTGIGLATVQRVVARHGGYIWAESVPERGATFYFTLGETHAGGAG